MFKVGDIVRCMKPSPTGEMPLPEDYVGVVSWLGRSYSEDPLLYFEDQIGGWFASRFEKVESADKGPKEMTDELYNLIDSREADAEHEQLRALTFKSDGQAGYRRVYIDPEHPNNLIYER